MKVYDEKNERCGRLREGMVKICLRYILVLEEERRVSQFIPKQSLVKALTFEVRDKDRQSICRILSVVKHHLRTCLEHVSQENLCLEPRFGQENGKRLE